MGLVLIFWIQPFMFYLLIKFSFEMNLYSEYTKTYQNYPYYGVLDLFSETWAIFPDPIN